MISSDTDARNAGNAHLRPVWVVAHGLFAAIMVLLVGLFGYVSLFVAACVQSDACPDPDHAVLAAPLLALVCLACAATNIRFAFGRPRRAGVILFAVEVGVFALASTALSLFGL